MCVATLVHPLNWQLSPRDAIARWRRDVPLLALTSGGESPEFDQWTILAPRTTSMRFDASQRDARALLHEIRTLAPVCDPALTSHDHQRLPFASGWIGFIGYECGALFEPHATREHGAHSRVRAPRLSARAAVGERATSPWPDAILCRVARALIYSHARGEWFEVGDPNAQEVASLVGDERNDEHDNSWSPCDGALLHRAAPTESFTQLVARTIEFIRAGDIFQANIAQEFHAAFTGSSRAFICDALECAAPRYGAALELDSDRTLLSLSPELFLAVDGSTRTVTTRPIKGTRPRGNAGARGEARVELLASEKDAAELNMIVDLMRSDLGRVCETGSVRVARARAIEEHPTILHTVAEISGTLAPSADLATLVAATFPPGSVTGAPKVRAMQIIDELEASRRGPYCGAIGFSSGCGSALLNVAIRTAALTRDATANQWQIDYRAGCGVVEESDPRCEDAESLEKTLAMRNILSLRTAHAHQSARS